MIDFHRVSLKDRDKILEFSEINPHMNCDFSFANLYNWGFYYKTEVAYHNGYMIIRFESDDPERPAYLIPVGDHGLTKVLEDMEMEMREQNQQMLTLMAVSDEAVEELRKTHPENIHVLSSRDYSDYIYLREKLATYSGKKLQSKRNHVNKFKRLYPDWKYEEITKDNIQECIEVEERWYQASAQTSDITEERRMVMTALREYDEIGLRGGCIRVEDKIVAFTLGMRINKECFDVCIEKADTNYEGAFTIICQEFAKRIPEQYIYVNREEDLGIEGLRKAKLSLKPAKLLTKNTVVLRYD